jgi:anti-sigma regulatory factor (Ser/Thr protein kinase)
MWHESRQMQSPLPAEYLVELRRWARQWTVQHAPVYADPDSVVLVMTEMVTNAICHAAGPLEVELARDSRVMVVGVSDRSQALPRPLMAETEAEGGRGLILLERLASRWGVRTHPQGGKTVWCEFT